MFDDQPIDNKNNPPGNLPMDEPVDIFGDTEEEKISNAGQPVSNEQTESTALDAGVLRAKAEGVIDEEKAKMPQIAPGLKPISFDKPSQPNGPITPPSPSQIASQTQPIQPAKEIYEFKEPKIGKVITIIVIIILGLVLLAGASWWLYVNFIQEPTAQEQIFEQEEQTASTTNGVGEKDQTGQSVLDDELLFGAPVDSDGDGLDDVRESDLGTDENNWDTDNDSLSDYDEVVIWKTDPLNPDSDGDSYLDGNEVKSGYSPTGSGRLFELPVE